MTLLNNLGFIFIITLLITIILFCISFLMARKIKTFYNEKSKKSLELFYVLVSFLTVFSIIFGVIAFYYEQNQRRITEDEINNIILENAKREIEFNLGLIQYIKENEEEFRNTQAFASNRFQYYYLEKAQDIIKDIDTRMTLIDTVRILKESNEGINKFAGELFLTLNQEQLQLYKKLKNEGIGTLKRDFIKIESNSKIIRYHIDKIIV